MSGHHDAPAGLTGAQQSNRRGGVSIPEPTVGERPDDVAPAPDWAAVTTLWARARVQALAAGRPLPEYGTEQWHHLEEEHPLRIAALIVAADRPRQPAPDCHPPQRRRYVDPRPPRATPGWPPVAVPGMPGVHLVHPSHHRRAA